MHPIGDELGQVILSRIHLEHVMECSFIGQWSADHITDASALHWSRDRLITLTAMGQSIDAEVC